MTAGAFHIPAGEEFTPTWPAPVQSIEDGSTLRVVSGSMNAALGKSTRGQTSELSRELPPGKYRIRIDALGQVLEEALTIVPDQTTILALAVEGDRFVVRH